MVSSRFTINPTITKSKRNFRLFWIDGTVHAATADNTNTLQKLRAIIPDVQLIYQPDKAMELLTITDTETSFVITSGAFGQQLVPRIHSLRNVHGIFIFCQNVEFHSEWSKEWKKVMEVNKKIDPICAALRQAVKQCNQDNIAMVLSDASDANNWNQLPSSFMYKTLVKDAMTTMDHDHDKEMQKFYQNALGKYSSKNIQRSHLDEFQQNYRSNQAIQLYTKQAFPYAMMNHGLRYLQDDVIVDVGLSIHDLHHQLVQLHREQAERFGHKTFKVYRDQGLTEQDLQQLLKDRLLEFNNFLSTSLKRERSMVFAQGGTVKPNCVGILFKRLIQPRLNKIPLADIHDLIEFPNEAEVLFGIHAVFRIINIQSRQPEHLRLYKIELQLIPLTEHMGDNIGAGWDWHRIGWILEEINRLPKAEEVYLDLPKTNPSTRDKVIYNHQPELINDKQGNYQKPSNYYLKGLEFNKQVLPDTHGSQVASIKNMGGALNGFEENSKAFEILNLALTILSKTLPSTHTRFTKVCRNTALIYRIMKDYRRALQYFKKADIWKKLLPATIPHLIKVKGLIAEMQATM